MLSAPPPCPANRAPQPQAAPAGAASWGPNPPLSHTNGPACDQIHEPREKGCIKLQWHLKLISTVLGISAQLPRRLRPLVQAFRGDTCAAVQLLLAYDVAMGGRLWVFIGLGAPTGGQAGPGSGD